ncbi:MAG: 4-hydroxy-3-methylbut-2-enyl diphosphate reductase [Nitrospiraceae bacterium]|nr:MAG: 4-hydroxy-3-methylbut-2-enyl diphosphate reductase [Nitrospiraceae bacterium]
MKVKLAKTAGFCMGVRRAMNIVLDAANKKKGELYTYGPLVHNPQAVEMLKEKGVSVITDTSVSDATVIIRAHGIPPKERKKIKESGNLICDATCPHVARAHALIRKGINQGYTAIIIGDKGHAEVNGLLGYAEGRGYVIESESDVAELPEIDRACIVAQTTQDRHNFAAIVDAIRKTVPDVQIHDTICDSTNIRQKEVRELAREVDAMVIVGGKNSANTLRLHEISLSAGVPSYHIEGEDELESLDLEQYENIGVMAGASTPNWVINKVIERIKILLKKRQRKLYSVLERVGDFIVGSSLYLSLGAVSMGYASLVFQGITPSATILSIIFLYIFSVHIFNRYTEKAESEFYDSIKSQFFKKYGKAFIITAMIASAISLYLSYMLDVVYFILLLFSYLMGVIYSLRIVPERLQHMTDYKRLKDFPGSKDVFVALAWAWVIVLIPNLNQETFYTYESLSVLFFVISTVFIRSVVFDVVSIEGDRIVGRETIPILIGPKHTEIMLLIITVIMGIYMGLSAVVGLVPSLGYFFILPPVLMVACLYIIQKQRIRSNRLFEVLIDSFFLLIGLITYIWQTV